LYVKNVILKETIKNNYKTTGWQTGTECDADLPHSGGAIDSGAPEFDAMSTGRWLLSFKKARYAFMFGVGIYR
jgi:hypothetical protein